MIPKTDGRGRGRDSGLREAAPAGRSGGDAGPLRRESCDGDLSAGARGKGEAAVSKAEVASFLASYR